MWETATIGADLATLVDFYFCYLQTLLLRSRNSRSREMRTGFEMNEMNI